MVMVSGPPDEFVSSYCMRNAALSKNGRSLALVSTRNALAFPEVTIQMRRSHGPFGSAARQDVLLAADLDTVPEEQDFASWAVYREAKKEKKQVRGGSR